MKKLVLYFLTVYDNAIRNLILLSGCFLSCMLLLGILYSADEYNTIFSYAKNGHIEDYVFVSDNREYSLSDEKNTDLSLEEALANIHDTDVSYFAADLQVMCPGTVDEDGEILEFNIAYPGTPSFNEMKQRIAEGRLPEALNEIVLCNEAKAYFSLGESIELGYLDIHEDHTFDSYPLTVKVVGFMPENPIYKDDATGATPSISLNDMLNRQAPDNYFLEGFIGQPFDYTDDGVPVKLCHEANILTCRSTDGRTAEKLCEDILKAYPGLSGSIITGSTLKEHYWQEIRPTVLKLLIAFVLSIMLFTCFLIGSLYLQAREKSLEICVLYAHGMTWTEASFLVCASYFPGIILGMICAIIVFFGNAEQAFGLICDFRFSYVAWTCLICLGISILCTIPIFIRMARQSPIEVIRKD